MLAVIGLATAWKVLEGTSLCTAVEPVAIARCETAVRDGVAGTFCVACAPFARSSARPVLAGRTWLAMNWSMNCGLAPSSEMMMTFGTGGSTGPWPCVELAGAAPLSDPGDAATAHASTRHV